MIRRIRDANKFLFIEDFSKVAHRMLPDDEAHMAVLAFKRCRGNIFEFLLKNEMYDDVMDAAIKEVSKWV